MNGQYGRTTGERVKALKEKYGYTNETLGEKLGLEPNSVSRCISGKRGKFSDEAINKLADLFHVQPEFLRCETDYETVESKYEALAMQDAKEHKAALEYLKRLGLDIVAKLYFVGTCSELYEAYFDLESVMSDETKKKLAANAILPSRDKYCALLEENGNFEYGLPHCDELYDALHEDAKMLFGENDQEYHSDCEVRHVRHYYIELVAKPNVGYLGVLNASLETEDTIAPSVVWEYPEERELADVDDDFLENVGLSPNDCGYRFRSSEGVLAVMYSVHFKNKFLGLYEPENLERLFGVLDSVCMAAIESILDSKNPIITRDTAYIHSVIV